MEAKMFQHILIPTDGSDLSQKAISDGIRFARSMGARVTGFCARRQARIQLPEHWDAGDYESSVAELEAEIDEEAKRHLALIENAAREAGVSCHCLSLVSDSPFEAIIRAAEGQGCDLIVMASHGRRGVTGLLLGSETMKVLTHCKIPVLVCR
jgi:nucleotide-binding universal stress UspA family protein